MSTIQLHGRRVGKLAASWMLFKETWYFLNQDRSMLWIPVINFFLGIMLVAVVALPTLTVFGLERIENSWIGYCLLGICYLIQAFVLALTQAAIAYTVQRRMHGNATKVSSALHAAWSKWQPLFVWACITSTVGVVIRFLLERAGPIGKLVLFFTSIAWAALTYFVAPAIMLDNHGAVHAIKHSGRTFKDVWGETFVTNFSINAVMLFILAAAFFVAGGLIWFLFPLGSVPVLFVVLGLLLLVMIVLEFVSVVLNGVIKTLLYIYAQENTLPYNFDTELLTKMIEGDMRSKATNESAS